MSQESEQIAELKRQLGVQTEAVRKWRNKYSHKRYKAKKRLDRIEELEKQLAEAKHIKSGIARSEGGWIWQNEGSDKLDSITCPIIITPDRLKELIVAEESLPRSVDGKSLHLGMHVYELFDGEIMLCKVIAILNDGSKYNLILLERDNPNCGGGWESISHKHVFVDEKAAEAKLAEIRHNGGTSLDSVSEPIG